MNSNDKKRSFEQTNDNTASNKIPKTNPKGYRIPKLVRDANGMFKSPQIPIHEVHLARKALRQHGISEFLNLYLPENATGSDLLSVVFLLGRAKLEVGFDIDDSENLDKIIKILKSTINRVLSSRDKLQDINTIEDTVRLIREAKNIIVLTGAGISTSLGIPDFRSDKGLYAQLQELGISDPTDVFDLEIFQDDPQIFYNIAHMVLPPGDVYTPLHSFIKKLSEEGKLLRNYTQNIDLVESNAGIPDDKVIRCHGSFATATCQSCDFQVDGHELYPAIREKSIPLCPHCKDEREKDDDALFPASFGVLKPDIVFFHESLPKRFDTSIVEDVKKCDLLIAIGTSLQVAPVSKIVVQVPASVPQILINRDPILDCEFDVNLLGLCDDVAVLLSEKLGWTLNHEKFNSIKDKGFTVREDLEEPGLYVIKPKSNAAEEKSDLVEQVKQE
ncbi:hypothetical protein WICPIJ_009375 [Wickerhamomyces pijperi]|uniref:Deacetylase sirtuin-type domain-containing protein n=1 Tax=Wickerhamomyces pijperi TaxID=599730 RepID=A0A9P8TDQ4_WICPI|nr:hypothetical protein WICPIJ_009375 [Wickerhamomyces pijperi]